MSTAAHTFHRLTIAAIRRETPDAIIVSLAVPEALAEAFRYRAGQHLAVRATLDGAEVRRTYSICSGTAEPNLRIGVKRVADGWFSGWANDTWKAGDTIEAMPPSGRFVVPPPVDGKQRHLAAFAAGIGITPIIAMIRHVLESEPASAFTLFYGNRDTGHIILGQELEDLKDRHLGRFSLVHILSRNDESETPLLEGRLTGDKVNELAGRLLPGAIPGTPPAVDQVFLCGPGSMIKDARNALMELGLPRERVHYEFFAAGAGAERARPATPPPTAAPVAPAAAAGPATEAVAILDGQRHRFRIPKGMHALDAAIAAGIRAPYACKGGMCCTCRAKVVEGRAHMAVNYSLEPWEEQAGFILTCQAIPDSDRLVLDYDQM